MKKIVSILAAVATLLSVTSCDKENGTGATPGQPSMDGSVKIAVVVPGNAKDLSSRAFTPSTVRPKTSWDNINSLMLLFVQPATGKVVAARQPDVTQLADLKAGNHVTFANAPEGTSDIYLVANHPDYNASSIAGQLISGVLAKLKATTPAPGIAEPTAGAVCYDPAVEIFVAKELGVTITAGTTTTVATALPLTRVISLLRARVDNKPYTTAGGVLTSVETEIEAQNAKLDFDGIRIRRATNSYSLSGVYAPVIETALSADLAKSVIYKAGAFKTVDPAAPEYTSGDANFDFVTLSPYWNEYKIYPAGSTDVNKALNVVLEATVKTGATYTDASGTDRAAGVKIYFAATLTKEVGPNQILEVLFSMKGLGDGGGEVPPLTQYGKLEISASVVDWGEIIGDNVEI